MKNKTTQILTFLSPKELKHFDKWLHSPWCNSNKKLPLLFRFLKKYHPHFESATLTKEKLFKKLYPTKKYDDKWMRNLLAALTGEAERFLQHERLLNNPQLGQSLLIEEYRERHQQVWFEKKTRQLIAQLEAQPGKDWEVLFELSRLYEQLHRQPGAVARQLSRANALQQADQWLDQLYALGKLRFLAEFAERNKIVEEQYEFKTALDYLSQLSFDTPVLATNLYLKNIATTSSADKNSFLKLKSAFFSIAKKLSKKDQTILLLLLLNRAGRLRLQAEKKIESDILDLYQFGLKHQLLLTNGRLTEATFTNIVVIANDLRAYSFVRDFIQNYYSKLSPPLQEDGKLWALAYTDTHATGKVDKGFSIALSQRRRDYTSFYIRSKALLLSIYFDEFLKNSDKEHSFLLDYCHAFEKLLQRPQNYPKKNRLAIAKSVQYIRKLYLLCQEPGPKKRILKKIENEIHSQSALHDRLWLLQKIEQIRKPPR